VLVDGGALAIRNSTRANNMELEWLRFFPEAAAIENARHLEHEHIIDVVSKQGFVLESKQTIRQIFAKFYMERKLLLSGPPGYFWEWLRTAESIADGF
jgi:hypothetical protein